MLELIRFLTNAKFKMLVGLKRIYGTVCTRPELCLPENSKGLVRSIRKVKV